MELDLTEDQAFFAQTTRKFLAAECSITAVRALESSDDGFDRDYWRRGCELGWTSMLVSEADGGGSLSDHGILDLVLVAEEMGAAVAPGPLVPVSVVASTISAHGSPAQKRTWLPGLLSGELIAAWVSGDGAIVEAGAQADVFLVTVDGEQRIVAAADATISPLVGLDLVRRFARVEISADAGEPIGGDGERELQIAVALQSAETCGAMQRIFDVTLEYMADRYSFGRPLSSYQALKHRVADNKMHLEASHAIATAAARAIAEDAPDANEVVSAAKSYIGAIATELIQDCVQLHGGIGVTWEHDLHLYLRRATVNRATYGTPTEHRERIAATIVGAA
ncbi:MAG: acyl-CoA/acyl-ACP dehydrogenase [Actinobacteria bacterium]|nr:acyl-CoA/acyl-ACP dehydrogenase [Actinomycetota bacterium]